MLKYSCFSIFRMNYQFLLFGVIVLAMPICGMADQKEKIIFPEDNEMSSQNKGPYLAEVLLGANNFGKNLNKILAKEILGNYACSSFSIHMLLSMALLGTRGRTKIELQQSLYSKNSLSNMENGYQIFLDMLKNSEEFELVIANKIFIANDICVKNEFKETTKKYFQSEIQSLNFREDEISAKAVNNWVSTCTKNRIKEIIKPDDIRDEMILMANAIYFKGKWATPFSDISPENFFVKKIAKQVDMMIVSAEFHWGEINNFNARYIELPYTNETFSMFIIVPNTPIELKNIEENFHKINFGKLAGEKSAVELHLPKFSIESTLNLKLTLEKLNIKNIFEENADFSGIDDKANLKVGKVFQKVIIDVDKDGTEAAAVTKSNIGTRGLSEIFHVNKPFFCAITMKINDGVRIELFNARVVDPSMK